ncbi:hypothetical protein Fmac_030955 [Flemingia macrophylla]|uniref:Uncharacterized protein n=1 Tax=Flemingia macrophylla TaxID=520843 RepID=A0ABD1L0P5_9FABA
MFEGSDSGAEALCKFRIPSMDSSAAILFSLYFSLFVMSSLDRAPEESLEGKPWPMFPSGFAVYSFYLPVLILERLLVTKILLLLSYLHSRIASELAHLIVDEQS